MVRTKIPPIACDLREKLGSPSRRKKNHVGAGSQLRNLQRHGNDHAQDRATNHDGCSDFRAGGFARSSRFEPAEPIGITRVRAGLAECFDQTSRSWRLLPRQTFDDRDRGRAPFEKRSGSGFFDFDPNRESLRDNAPSSVRVSHKAHPTAGRSISPSGFTAHPIPCTRPREALVGHG